MYMDIRIYKISKHLFLSIEGLFYSFHLTNTNQPHGAVTLSRFTILAIKRHIIYFI